MILAASKACSEKAPPIDPSFSTSRSMGNTHARGEGRALAEERMRAEIAVKLHMAVGGKQGHRQALEQAFHASDADGDGSVDFAEFCSTAAAIGLGVSEPQLRSAFDKFDRNGDKSIEFEEVINFMCPKVYSGTDATREAHVEYLSRLAAERKPLEVEEDSEDGVHSAVYKVAESIFSREINVRKAFLKWDRDGSGQLDVAEFTDALNSLGFSLDLADAQRIFQRFDVDGDGKIACA
jgi:Ca2+-binding EF-hand superfamily protein